MESGIKELQSFEYTNILGWSVSRYDVFSSCKRQYYYEYYSKFDPEIPRMKIETLKRMTSIPLEIGNIVHDTIKVLLERLLKSEEPIDKDRFYDFAKRKTIQYCGGKTFSEVYYKQRDDVKPQDLLDSVLTALESFISSERYKWILTSAISNKNRWIIEPPGFGETRIDGLKAFCKVDFLFPVDDIVYILDWKTGKPDDKKHKKQLCGYSLWAWFNFKFKFQYIKPIIAYLLPSYQEITAEFNEFDFQEFAELVKIETHQMYSYCQNVEKNIPKAKSEFPLTQNKNICRFCNYRELCE